MYFKKNSKKKAELSTILTIGAFVFIGVSSIISTVFSPQRTTTQSRASEILSDACKHRVDNKVYVFFKRNGARPLCSVDQIRQGSPSDPVDSWLVDESKRCTTNSNCGDGAWCYFFENKASKARCMTRDLSCDNGVCLSGSSDSSNNNPPPNPGSNTQPAPGGNQSGSSQPSYSANSCFSIGADFEVRNDGDRKAFYSWVTFRSQTPGSLSLFFNNAGVAGPNSFGGGEYTYNPVWTQPFTHSNEAPAAVLSRGQSNSIWYRGVHSGCSSAQVIDINCNLSYDNNGSTIVSGAGCSCRNCQIFSPPPTPTPRPPSNRSPGTSSGSRLTPTPTLKVTTTNQITKGQDGAPCTVDSDCISNYCNLQLEGGVCQSKSNKTSLTLDNSRQNQGNLPNPTLNPSIIHAWSKFREQENATRRSTSATIPTPTPTSILTSTLNRCKIPTNNFIQNVGYSDCPKEEILDCGSNGKRYLNIKCGSNNEFCDIRCKDIYDLLEDKRLEKNYYRRNCSLPDTCIDESINKTSMKIDGTINFYFTNYESCKNNTYIEGFGFGIRDGDKEQYFKRYPAYGFLGLGGGQSRPISWFVEYNQTSFDLSIYNSVFKPPINIFPINRKIQIRPYVEYFKYDNGKRLDTYSIFGEYKEIDSLTLFAIKHVAKFELDCSNFK